MKTKKLVVPPKRHLEHCYVVTGTVKMLKGFGLIVERKTRKYGVPWSQKQEMARRVRQRQRLEEKRARKAQKALR